MNLESSPNLTSMNLAQLRSALDEGAASSEQLVRALLERAAEYRHLNAFITLDAEGALAAARRLDQLHAAGDHLGPLHGIPLVVKDNIHVVGMPNTAGTPALAGFVPGEDSPAVARLRAAGAIILGKTNMHELAFGITSNNPTYGAVGNPRDPSTFAGGSSGGSASAIAANLAPAGLGTDTGGSVRIPAALTGIAALRPSIDRYPNAAVTPISTTRDTIGPMGRTVQDVALLDGILASAAGKLAPLPLRGLRLGVPGYFYTDLDAETRRVTDDVLQRLQAEGVTLVEAEIPRLAELTAASGFPIALFEAVRDLRAYLTAHHTGVSLEALFAAVASPDVKGIVDAAVGPLAVPPSAYREALDQRSSLQQSYRDYFSGQRVDGIVFPTTVLPARPIEGSIETVALNGQQAPTFATYIRNTDPASIAGIPGLTIPVGATAQGLPVGLELDGPLDSDRRLLAIGLSIEALFLR